MVLVDTSVWVRFLAGRGPHADELDRLLSRDEVLGHDLVYGELLIGDPGGRKRLLAMYAQMSHAASVAHDEVVTLVREQGLHGSGLGWIDAHLLASSLVSRASLWTADGALHAAAVKLGVAHARGA